MKGLVVNTLLLFFVSAVVFLITNNHFQKKFDALIAEKNSCQNQLKTKKEPVLTLKDASFVASRDKELESVIKSQLYFTAKIKKQTIGQWSITIELIGKTDGAVDAADLKLELPEGFIATDLKVGTAFPLYPRKVIAPSYLLITGLALSNNNQMIFGKPNKIFAEFTLKTVDNQPNKKQITVNKEDTKIYLNGESVLDTGRSISLINLP